MNIGIFTDTYNPHINGVVTSVNMLKKELEKKGHKVYIFTTSDPNAGGKQGNVFRLPSMPFVFLPSHRLTFMYPPRLLLRMKKIKLDIIHTQTEFPIGIFGQIVSEFYKIPDIHTYHTMYEDYVHYLANGHLLTPKMAQKLSRIFCNRANAVIAPVDKTKNYLLSYGVNKPIKVIPTGIEFQPFERGNFSVDMLNKTKEELGLNISDSVVVYVGRLGKEKSIDVIINAMPKLLEKLPEVKLVIVGSGKNIQDLKELSQKNKTNNSVIFVGAKPWEEIGRYYQIGDVFTTASTSETQGLTYLEAMAAKVPVVAKKDPSTEGIITDLETGYFFEKDEQAADILYRALTDRQLSRKIAENAYQNVQYLSSEKFAENIEKLYKEVILEFDEKENTKEKKKNKNKNIKRVFRLKK